MGASADGPRRVLLLSAPVGEGHVAAARALAVRMRRLWPGARVDEVETVGGGRWRTRWLRFAYAATMRCAPRLYGLGYDLLVRLPAVAAFFKAISARGTGRRLAGVMAGRPDLVVSTYPLASGGLAWLRRHGRLPGRAVAVVTDAAVHPFWVWPELDETWTLLPAAAEQARRWAPTADVRVAPPAVDPLFVPGDRAAARATEGLDPAAFVVAVAGGSLGLGDLEAVVDAALARTDVTVLALCGRNERLARRLRDRTEPRLVVHGWINRVPGLLIAADLVVTTGGGMMATEALAVGRPVLFAAPVPGHGRAGAEVMAAAGIAVVARGPAELTAALGRLRPGTAERRALTRAAEAFGRADLDAELRALARRC